jgi:butyrate kinase
VEKRIEGGDRKASLVFEAMVYQIAKEGGAMAAVLEGRVDAILLTGGMAFSERMIGKLRTYLEWIAPIRVFPGEDELEALAEGVFRVLDGEERERRLWEEGRNPAGVQAVRKPLAFGIDKYMD